MGGGKDGKGGRAEEKEGVGGWGGKTAGPVEVLEVVLFVRGVLVDDEEVPVEARDDEPCGCRRGRSAAVDTCPVAPWVPPKQMIVDQRKGSLSPSQPMMTPGRGRTAGHETERLVGASCSNACERKGTLRNEAIESGPKD